MYVARLGFWMTMPRRDSRAFFLLSCFLAAGKAAAQPEPPQGAASDEVAPKKKKKKDGDAEAGTAPAASLKPLAVALRGRVLARAAWEHQTLIDPPLLMDMLPTERSRRDLFFSVPSARASLRARAFDYVTLVLEADFSPRPVVKDAFIRARQKRWAVQAGHFKMPLSSVTLESPWNLPIARRGLLQDMLEDALLLVGRRPGVTGTLQGGGSWDPALTLGVFQGVQFSLPIRAFDAAKPYEHTFVGRFSVTPAGQELAAVGQIRSVRHTVELPERMVRSERYWAAGMDATLDFDLDTTALRVWIEALVGSSWIQQTINLDKQTFVTGRAVAGYRFGGAGKGQGYLEPFASIGFLDPDTDVVSDLFWEAMAGLNLGHFRSTRLTLQVEYARSGRNARQPLLWLQAPIKSHVAGILQLGAAF